MRAKLLALVVAMVGSACSVVASAAPRTPAAVVAHNWSGYYIGGNAGYGFGGASNPSVSVVNETTPPQVDFFIARGGNVFPSLTPDGFVGGGQIGWNWHKPGSRWVLGVEADFQYSAMKAGDTALVQPPLLLLASESLSLRMKWFGTVRGRIGQTLGEREDWLVYATGGLAYGRVSSSLEFVRLTPPVTVGFSESQSETLFGWTAGAGLERALGAWSLGAEYLYFDLGRAEVSAPFLGFNLTPPGNPQMVAEQRVNGHIVRARLSYRLGSPPPPP